MNHRIDDLFETPQHIALVARWIFDAFWTGTEVHTPDSLANLLQQATSREVLPVSLLAFDDDQPIGTVNLVENDDDRRRHLKPWLAALFVIPEYRRRGVGTALCQALGRRAAEMGVDAVFLGTDQPGFYEQLGARVYETVSDTFCIMRLETNR